MNNDESINARRLIKYQRVLVTHVKIKKKQNKKFKKVIIETGIFFFFYNKKRGAKGSFSERDRLISGNANVTRG